MKRELTTIAVFDGKITKKLSELYMLIADFIVTLHR